MGFKGTKGNWKLACNEYGYYTSVRNFDNTRKVCVSRVNNQIENNANLLLISKTPEILEMLKEIIEQANEVVFVNSMGASETYFQLINKAEQLIKEATEI